MEIITSEEISRWKTQFQETPAVLNSLDKLEECQGNLNEAMEIALFQAGYEAHRGSGDDWIDWDNILKNFTHVLCHEDFKSAIVEGYWGIAMAALLKNGPAVLATPIFLYVLKKGVAYICQKLHANEHQ